LTKLIEAQRSVLETQARFQQQADELDDLRRQLRALDEWQEECKKYELFHPADAQSVYRLREEYRGDDPEVWFCPHCFTTERKISILQLWNHRYSTRACHACHFQITPAGESQVTTLGQEQAALQERNRLLHAEVVALRQQAHYHRSQHRRAVARAEELQAQVDVLKAKVAELQQRLFGRKSERTRRATLLGGRGQSGVAARARGQQPGLAGHGRTRREALPVVEVGLDLCDWRAALSLLRVGMEPVGSLARQ
jgi:hypothetical protein